MGCKIKLQQKRAKNNAGESGKNHPIRSGLIKRYFIGKKHGHPFMYTLIKFYGKNSLVISKYFKSPKKLPSPKAFSGQSLASML